MSQLLGMLQDSCVILIKLLDPELVKKPASHFFHLGKLFR